MSDADAFVRAFRADCIKAAEQKKVEHISAAIRSAGESLSVVAVGADGWQAESMRLAEAAKAHHEEAIAWERVIEALTPAAETPPTPGAPSPSSR